MAGQKEVEMAKVSGVWVSLSLMLMIDWNSKLYAQSLTVTSEVEALRTISSDLRLPAYLGWNSNADPCEGSSYGSWIGVNCSADGTHVTMIRLSSMSLSGKLTAAIANLTLLSQLDLSNNQLSGEIPESLGTLRSLQSLSLGVNNLTGSIPYELGELSNLTYLGLDNNLLTGSIPASFANISSLTRLHLYCNNLDGGVPPGFSSLSQLTEFQVQSNHLNGTVPDSLALLHNLNVFSVSNNRLSGELNLSVFEGMPYLRYLYLQRNNFTGQVPDFSGTVFPFLLTLDLSFNEFSGGIPSSLGNFTSLKYLYLSHNKLTGQIPDSLARLTVLQIFDVSHNSLTGSLNATLSLIGSTASSAPQFDFSFNYLNLTSAPAELVTEDQCNMLFNCVPEGSASTCSQSSPGKNTGLSINVGGSNAIISNGQDFQPDMTYNHSTGITYDSSCSWALQLSGKFGGYASSNAAIVNSDNSTLYQTFRWSSSFLAYHTFGLSSGSYQVTLHFAETMYDLPGYRVFDVYVQGELWQRELDVVKEVGKNAAYKLQNEVNVTDGLVSIELSYVAPKRWFDPSKYAEQASGPMLSAFSVISNTVIPSTGAGSGSTGTIVAAVVGPIAGLGALLALVICCLCGRRWKWKFSLGNEKPLTMEEMGPTVYTYQELYHATNGFSLDNKIGQGGFGAVFKGVLSDGSPVAVKQMTHFTVQSRENFKKEIAIINSVKHRFLLTIKGYSIDSEFPLLVCDLLPNGSLDRMLFNENLKVLTWEVRLNIAVGVASGLAYLHDESQRGIIHCDVKPANILLDEDFNPRIADFGLARLYDADIEHHVTTSRAVGTPGYVAPEYALHHHLSTKADVYSFGVVLLELVSGRKTLDLSAEPEEMLLVGWFRELLSQGIVSNFTTIVDTRLDGQYSEKEVLRMLMVASLCTNEAPSLRPTMRSTWLMLKGTIDLPTIDVHEKFPSK